MYNPSHVLHSLFAKCSVAISKMNFCSTQNHVSLTLFFLLALSIIIYFSRNQCKKSMKKYPFIFSPQVVSH